ncbi:MAG: hypothetical protein HYX78_03280 [Armatimonadetes bacterium]|nr:hypothetical protein [Armatimonadota bacterium]
MEPKDGVITAGEPVLARVEIVNESGEDLTLMTGNSSAATTYFEVRAESGKVVAATPRPQLNESGIQGAPRFPAGAIRTNVWIISALYDFQQPGLYQILVQQLERTEGLPIMAEAASTVRVLPFDAAKLKARCEELSKPMREGTSYGDLDVSKRSKALLAVRHDIVLPYLEWLAKEWADAYAIRAMRRLGTDQAQRLVNELAAREDRVGVAAQRALQMSIERQSLLWDMGW